MKFIIYTPNFTENSGGVIALHYLCHLLNEKGHNAYIKKFVYPPKLETSNIIRFIRTSGYFLIYFYKKYFEKFKTYNYFNTPIINKIDDINKYIVVYPDIVQNNPLNSKKVVRWFLSYPKGIEYGENELYFFYQVAFNDNKINPNSHNILRNIYYFDNIYKQTNFSKRKGKCYIIRKGGNRVNKDDINDGIIIDGKSHNEIAEIFNSCELCISYDLYTFYSYYATLCGCKSIVIPEDGIAKENWQPEENLRFGIGYGINDEIDYSKEKIKLEKLLNDEKHTINTQIDNFIQKCAGFFK